jgi:hypothetical protein
MWNGLGPYKNCRATDDDDDDDNLVVQVCVQFLLM